MARLVRPIAVTLLVKAAHRLLNLEIRIKRLRHRMLDMVLDLRITMSSEISTR